MARDLEPLRRIGLNLLEQLPEVEQICIRDSAAFCRHRPCNEAQGVLCCGGCPFYKDCVSKCEKIGKGGDKR